MNTHARHPTPHRSMVTLFLTAGGLLLVAAAAGFFPVVRIADIASASGVSDYQASLFRSGQWALGLALILAGCWLARSWLGHPPPPPHPSVWARRPVLLASLAAGALTLVVQGLFFDHLPHITDATSHAFQAQIFASGRLAVPIPPCFEAFFQHNVIIGRSGWWHTKYFPGQALWLAPGYLIHAPWLMMPLAWGLTVACLGGLVRRFGDPEDLHPTLLLAATSPLGLLLGASFMSHTPFLLGALAGWWGIARAFDAGSAAARRGWLVGAGLALGFAAITRPQDAAPFVVAGGLILLLAPPPARRRLIGFAPWILLGITPALALLFAWNHTLYGGWLSSGYHFGSSPSLTPIIQDSLGFTAQHTPMRALRFAALTLFRLDSALSGWPTALPLLALPLLRRRPSSLDIVLVGTVVSTVVLYLFFHYLGFELEARYYAPALPAALWLAVRGLNRLCRIGGGGDERRRAVRGTLLVAGGVYALVFYWPVYLAPKYGQAYEQVHPGFHRAAEAWRLVHPEHPRLLVLIESDALHDFNYSAGFVFNDPDLSRPVIYARYRPDQVACLREAFPDRTLLKAAVDASRLTLLAAPAPDPDDLPVSR